ncbi:hypothetical protein [Streptomyces sp. NPDC045251]|uniref:hypothetical protein n=1 Tax=unclassified Streptomyces TaxID=2593676 RepID=UPI0033D2F59C
MWLHYRTETNKQGHDESHFTLLPSDGDQPVPITGMAQIRHRLAARAAGLPLAPATGTDDRAGRAVKGPNKGVGRGGG